MNKKKIFTLIFMAVMIGICIIKITTDEEIVINNEVFKSGETTKILLYFYDSEREMLAPEYREVSLNEIKENMEHTIVNELLKGPAISGFERVLPKGVKLNSIKVENGKATVDLSEELVGKEVNEASEEERVKKIFSIVYTLTEIKEINSVEIRVNGELYAEEKRM